MHKKWLILFLAILLFLMSSTASMGEDLHIHFAGFAFRGDDAQIKTNFPFTSDIAEEKLPDNRQILDAALVDRLRAVKLKQGELIFGELAQLGDGSLILGCCLDTELVTVEEYDEGYKIVIDLGAQALLFDYERMRLVASYPIMVELIDFTPQEPDHALILDRVRDLLLSNKYGINLLDDFVSLLTHVTLRNTYGSAIRVTRVDVEELALAELPDKFSQSIENFQTFVAQNFGKYLSRNQGMTILPYTKGGDIGNKMAIRFSDATVYELTIPEPQFAVEIAVRGFKKILAEQKEAGSCWIYGAFTNIKICQPTLGKVYLDEKVKFAVSKIIPSSQKSVQDWPSYQNSLIALLNDLTQRFSKDKQYKSLQKVIDQCS
jgi:hypothetical protein